MAFRRIKKYLLILAVLILLAFIYFYVDLRVRVSGEPEWGITYSKAQAEGFGLDWQETYIAILDELGTDHVRLSAYWNEIESNDDEFDFSALDFLVNEAASRDAKILLALGRRVPRWPECHVPQWAGEMSAQNQNAELLEYIREVVNRYKDNSAIWAWQVENELYLTGFGECPAPNSDFFDTEIRAVRELDPRNRPIVTTDSGELGDWIRAMRRGDIFGTTMYRRVYNPILGFATYPIAPVYYERRFALFQPFLRADRIIDVELQAEPWSRTNDLKGDSIEDWNITMAPELFENNLDYARKSGIDLHYLWGAEWWYYAKEERNHEIIWKTAKKLWLD